MCGSGIWIGGHARRRRLACLPACLLDYVWESSGIWNSVEDVAFEGCELDTHGMHTRCTCAVAGGWQLSLLDLRRMLGGSRFHVDNGHMGRNYAWSSRLSKFRCVCLRLRDGFGIYVRCARKLLLI